MGALKREAKAGGRVIYRHDLVVRLTHWTIAVALAVLLFSGLQIFNARPDLYWGQKGADADPTLVAIGQVVLPNGHERGVVQIGSHRFDTTGVLGYSKVDGQWTERGFPAWATLPPYQDLADGRTWHFFFAWVLAIGLGVYLVWSVVSGRLLRDLVPSWAELQRIPLSLWRHLRLRYARGEEARAYDVLQKVTYLPVVIILLPVMILTGLTMSPAMDAAWPWLLTLFGGRQSARTIHFCVAFLLVLFFLVHISQVLLAGPINELRSIVTGWFDLREAPGVKAEVRHDDG